MTDAIQVALIAAAPPTIVALTAIVVSLLNRRHTKQDIQAVHVLINSRMDAWLKAAEALARIQGVAEGRQQSVTESERVQDRADERAKH